MDKKVLKVELLRDFLYNLMFLSENNNRGQKYKNYGG